MEILALKSRNPVNLGDRCTVFIESAIAASLSSGVLLEDIAAGLCYSISNNYLNKVVAGREVTGKVFFQGGVAFNQGVINAFRALTGKQILVPPHFSVTGAYGIAILTKDELDRKAVCDLPVKRNICLKSENSERRLQLKKGEYFSSKISNMFLLIIKMEMKMPGKVLVFLEQFFHIVSSHFFMPFSRSWIQCSFVR